MVKDRLEIEDITVIYSLFKSKGWKIDETNRYSLYNRFLKTYGKLDKDQRRLFINMSYEFRLVTPNEYLDSLCEILVNMQSAGNYAFKDRKDIYIMPLLSIENDRKIKSSTFMSYLFSSKNLFYYDCLAEKNFHIIDNYEQLRKKKEKLINNPLILTDDFIGSGKQACEAIDCVLSEGININNIHVVTPFIHNVGLNTLRKKNIMIYTNHIIDKHFKDNSSLNKDINIMSIIEKQLQVDDYYSFGYMQSEALISMIRTPNNTFPLFWYKGKNKGKNFSPFPRK